FNIGYKYDVYEDRKAYEEYRAWTERWMAACCNVLKPTGSLWVAIGDDYAAEMRLIARKLGLHLRNWVVWHYTFGQSTRRKFARSHTHLFYWVKDPRRFTFNDAAVRVPSARQTTYADKRANPAGKLPDDVWSFSRVCGTFHERVEWHPCQMPERLLERIIKACSNKGELVIDPFSGSGTTCVVAARLGRQYFGIDISEKYVQRSVKRLTETLAGRRKATEIAEDPQALRPRRRKTLKACRKGR
ncbi:MAG: site-specific DNA-methyltransferase, partial [Phycisphaerae bacterium]|nr:site-specific DNA-methyltransferase [Phycisphaerae bacterium]